MKDLFQLDPKISYLNCAYMSPNLRTVEVAGMEGIMMKRNPAHLKTAHFFEPAEAVKRSFAKLIQADDPQRIAIVPSVSYGISIVARNLSLHKGDEIVLTGEQFPSNVYPWQRLAAESGAKIVMVAAPDQRDGRGKGWNERILDAIGEKTRLVAMGHVHWTDGTLFDLSAIRAKSKVFDAALVIDGTQSVGALPFSVRDIQPDALVIGAYKWMLGPYGMGLAYFGEKFDQGIPLEENWLNRKGSEDFSRLVEYAEDYQPMAQRFEVGQRSNLVNLLMMQTALNQLHQWPPNLIQDHGEKLIQSIQEDVLALGCWIEAPEWRASHLFGIHVPSGTSASELKEHLMAENIFVSVRGTAVRVGPHLYNDENDMRRLLRVFTKMIS
ncbi:MAG: aminotransferase class V-fold PLP-dependent enzyme [Bacteroidota bacterium]